MMKVLGALIVAGVMCFTVTPASAYIVTLNTWNVQQLQDSGASVTVNIVGNTITFSFNQGSLANTFQAMDNIFFQPNVFPNTITGNDGSYTLECGTASGGGSCNADGFSINPAAAKYGTDNGGPGHPSTVQFTFANPVVAGLTSSDFDVSVTFGGSCSGFVDGSLRGSPTSNTNCTPVPEPITMFLGGTGLAILGYAARKRLLGWAGGLSAA